MKLTRIRTLYSFANASIIICLIFINGNIHFLERKFRNATERPTIQNNYRDIICYAKIYISYVLYINIHKHC